MAKRDADSGLFVNSKLLSHNGESLTIAEWAARLGCNYHTLWSRLQKYSVAEALSWKRKVGIGHTHNGVTKTLHEWAKELGISYQAFMKRIETHGFDGAFSAPSLNRYFTHDGVTLTQNQWARRLDVRPDTFAHRVKHLGFERAISMKRRGVYTVDGVTRTVKEWAKEVGLTPERLCSRIKRLGAEAAIRRTAPLREIAARRYVIDSIDSTPRTMREWTEFVGKTDTSRLYQARKEYGSLEIAVRALLDKRGKCAKGHRLEGDNILPSNSKNRCRTCLRNAQVAFRERKRKGSPTPVRNLADLCARGAHKMAGENLGIRRYVDGSTSRFCKACKLTRNRERLRQKRAGVFEARALIGMTVEQKLAHYSRPQPNGCTLWCGNISGEDRQRPIIYHNSLPSNRILVRTLLWERKTGQTLAITDKLIMSCGNGACIHEDHIVRRTRRGQREAATAKWHATLKANRLLTAAAPRRDEAIRQAVQLIPVIRKSLLRRFYNLQEELDDIVQDAILRMDAAIRKGQELGDLKAFLMVLARRVAVDRERKLRAVPMESLTGAGSYDNEEGADGGQMEMEIAAPEHADPAIALERQQIWMAQRRKLFRRLRLITPRARRAVLLRAEGLSQVDIAQKMGLSENTVEQHLRKAYAILRGKRRNAEALTALFTGTA